MQIILYIICLIFILNPLIANEIVVLKTYKRYSTEIEKNFVKKDEYKAFFSLSNKIQIKDSLLLSNFKDNIFYTDIVNNNDFESIFDYSNLQCDSINGKQFDEKNLAFIYCPIFSLNLNNKIIVLLQNERYFNLLLMRGKNIANFDESCDMVEKRIDSVATILPNIFIKKSKPCVNLKKNNQKFLLSNISAIYEVRFSIPLLSASYKIKGFELINDDKNLENIPIEVDHWLDFHLSYYIFVNSNGESLISDYQMIIFEMRATSDSTDFIGSEL